MGFETLLGNERVKENLQHSLQSGRHSHFYLISGPVGSGKKTLAQLLAAALMCEHGGCARCEACRKVMAATHPDVITVTDPDHKAVPVKMVRQIRDDMFIRPNEGRRKIYIFPQELGIEGQNALLKVLEEPPSYGVFILLSDNPEALLPTVRSRCVELAMTALPQKTMMQALSARYPQADTQQLEAATDRSGGYLGQALAVMEGSAQTSPQTTLFAQSYAQRDTAGLMRVLVPMEKWKRDQLIAELEQWRQLLSQSLVCRTGGGTPTPLTASISAGRTGAELTQGLEQLQLCIRYAQGNVSVAAICGYLLWALR